MSAKASGKGKRKLMDKDSEQYREKRDRNNVAVRKSREKSRQKTKDVVEKITKMKAENDNLEQKVRVMSKELNLLKDLLLSSKTVSLPEGLESTMEQLERELACEDEACTSDSISVTPDTDHKYASERHTSDSGST